MEVELFRVPVEEAVEEGAHALRVGRRARHGLAQPRGVDAEAAVERPPGGCARKHAFRVGVPLAAAERLVQGDVQGGVHTVMHGKNEKCGIWERIGASERKRQDAPGASAALAVRTSAKS